MMAEHALAYAALGWPVFPLRAGRKVPATPNGFKDATLDPERIERWWTRNPGDGVGIATGAAGLVVIDIDVKDEPGWLHWCALVAEHVEVEPRTREHSTPSGGAHLLFAAPAGVDVRCSTGKLAPGIDVRAVGGYIVAPPTVTGDGVYEVDRDDEPAPLPSWLLRLVDPGKPRSSIWGARSVAAVASRGAYGRAALEREVGRLLMAPVGGRNDALNRAAFSLAQLVASGQLDEREVVDALEVAAERVGLEPGETLATIRSGFAKGEQSPRRVA